MKNKKSRNKKTTIKSIKKVIIGGLSPVSASKKIQSKYREYSLRQSKKVDNSKKLLNKLLSIHKDSSKDIEYIDFRGIDLSGKVLSGKIFKKAKFQNVNLKNSKLNNCKLEEVSAHQANFEKAELKKAIIKDTTLKGANFEMANLENLSADSSNFDNCRFWGDNLNKNLVKLNDAKFQYCNIRNSSFTYCDLAGTRFIKTNLEETEFQDNKTSALPQFADCNLDYVSFFNNPAFIIDIVSTTSSKGEKNTINNLKIVNNKDDSKTSRDYILYDRFKFDNFTFNKLKIINVLIRDGAHFENCIFNKLRVDYVQFFKIKFDNCTFIDSDFFNEFVGFSNIFINCTFKNCFLNKSDFRDCNFTNSTFIACNMTGVDISESILKGVKFTKGTILKKVNFQHCTGMEGMNFQGLNLENSIFGGDLPGQNLRNCDFRDANLTGTQFAYTQIYRSNFRRANLNGSTVRHAEGSHETIGIPADLPKGRLTDTHQAFYNIRINMLLDFYKNHVDYEILKEYVFKNNKILTTATFSILELIIEKMDKKFDKEKLITGLNSCFKERLDHYDFEQNISGTDPPVNFRELIYWALMYMAAQSKEFKDLYVESLITDSTQALGASGLSCAAGIIERFVTVMEQVAYVLKDSVPEKKEEYEGLIGIIENDPEKLIKNYLKEWFEIHKEGGEDEYKEDTDTLKKSYKEFLEEKFDVKNLTGDEKEKIEKLIMNHPDVGLNYKDTLTKSYKEFLEEKFDVKNLRGNEKEKIEKLIMNHPDAGVNFLDKEIGIKLFFGGRKNRHYHKNIYSKKKTKKYRAKK